MNRIWLFVVPVIALAAVAALAQDRGEGEGDEVSKLRAEVATLREQVQRLEARVKELEAIFGQVGEVQTTEAAPPVADLSGPDDLKKAFVGSASKPRLVVFLSPT